MLQTSQRELHVLMFLYLVDQSQTRDDNVLSDERSQQLVPV